MIRYFSCDDRSGLDEVLKFDGNTYSDFDLSIDVVGKVNLNPPLEPIIGDDGEATYPEDTREPVYSDFLFNVIFLNDNKIDLFKDFKEETPKTPFRTFLM
ncbi:hypothetical protein [Dysgonomonas sp. 520]|uniref:hypothetical protein n=1 Tax=Dysgonomonas sp. 520 TaxID=2302931 RepID=UPI0013D25A23|nr:hypothetical protein [Dysgonomonas sp. 520]NDW10137.1 hypothetical protein [Dysgonomonas sp. 520]